MEESNMKPGKDQKVRGEVDTKIKRKKAKIAVISLCTIVVLILGLQVYASINGYGNVFFMIKELVTQKSSTSEEEIFIEGKDEKKDLDINSQQVSKLYSYIPALDVNTPDPANAYQDKKITMSDMDEKYLLAYAFTQLSLSETDKLPYMNEDGTKEDANSGWFSFKAELLQEKVKELYGKNIENQYFDYGIAQGCNYNNGIYNHSAGGSLSDIIFNVNKIEKAYEEEDVIYIEDKYMTLREQDDENTGKTSYKLYKSSNCTSFIDDLDSSLVQKLRGKFTEDYLEEIANKYENKMVKFKHTFKKDDNGSYYWYSTEPLEEIGEDKTSQKTKVDEEKSFFEKNSYESFKDDLKDAENGKISIAKAGEDSLKTTQHDGYYTYTDMWNNSYNIKKITDVKSEFSQLGKDKKSALYKCTIYYIDNNDQKKSFDVAVIVSKEEQESGIIGTFNSYTGSTSFTRWAGLYEETQEQQLEPDNYAEEVMKDEQKDPTNYITSINWKRFESADDGFSFVYPDNYTLVKSPDRGIVVEISGEAIGKDVDTGNAIKSNFKIRMYSTRNVESYEIRDILEKGTGYTNKNGDKWYTNYIEGYNTPGSAGYQKIENYVNYEDIGNGMYRQRMIEFEADNRNNFKITNLINHIISSIEIINM